eukprot:g6543.t1
MAAPAKPEAVSFGDATETEITVKWDAKSDETYKVRFKEITEEWDAAREVATEAGVSQATAGGLNPTSTYQFKLVAINASGASEESEDATFDTQVASCTPERKTCTVQ